MVFTVLPSNTSKQVRSLFFTIMPRQKGSAATKTIKTNAKAPAEVDAPRAPQAHVTVHVQGEAHAPPAGAASPDPDPRADVLVDSVGAGS